MLRSTTATVTRAVAGLIICTTLIAGCTYSVMPNAVPPVKDIDTASLAGAVLGVANEETSSREYDILDDKGQKQGITANRQAWSKALVEALASELARRGAQIRANAPLLLGISLPKITFNQHQDHFQFKVKVVVSAANGWTKTYEAAAESGSGFFETFEAVTNRLSGQVIAAAVKVMFSDAEFVAHLTGKS